VTQKYSHAI